MVKMNTDWKQYVKHFQIQKTIIDRLAGLLFYSDLAARFVMASPFTSLIYGVAGKLRSPEEKKIVGQLGSHRTYL
jgi:hypothetical protein